MEGPTSLPALTSHRASAGGARVGWDEPHRHAPGHRYASKCASLFLERRGEALQTEAPTFNAGVPPPPFAAPTTTAATATTAAATAATAATATTATTSAMPPPGHATLAAAPRAVSTSRGAQVLLIDLGRWRAQNLTEEAAWWMRQHAASADGLWALGSQPPLHLALHGRWAALPPSWNLDGLGRVGSLTPPALGAAKLLHWTGKRKPWLPDGLYVERWRRYVPWLCAPAAGRDDAGWHRVPWPCRPGTRCNG